MVLPRAAAAAVLSQLLVPAVGIAWWQAAVVSAAVVVMADRAFGPEPRIGPVHAALVLLASAIAAPAARAPFDFPQAHVAHLSRGDTQRLVADVVEPPRPTAHGVTLVVEARERVTDAAARATEPLHGRIRLSVRYAHRQWWLGDRIVFRSRLRPIENFGNPGELDFSGFNARRGIHVSAFVWDDARIESRGLSPDAGTIMRFRRAVVERAIAWGGDGGALVAALVVGDRSRLAAKTAEAIRAAGLAHVLAISGLHLGIVVGVLLWAVGRGVSYTRIPASGFDPARPAAIAAGIGLAAYAAISGGGTSVVRASVMGAAFLAAYWRGTVGSGVQALAGAALVVCLLDRGVVVEAGFQLSFAATAGILLYAGVLRSFVPEQLPRMLRAILEAAAVCLLCWWVTTPIVAYHFAHIALLGPIASLASALPVAAAIVAGMAAAVLAEVVPPAGPAAFAAAGHAGAIVLRVAEAAAALPQAYLPVVRPGAILTIALSGLAFVPAARVAARVRLLAVLVVVAVAATGHGLIQRYRGDRMEAYFLAVGQGDATVVRLPGGRVLLVDGGLPGRGRIVVAPMLARLWIRHIDVAVVTHVQDDHWGGLPELTRDVTIGELWHPGGGCTSERFQAFLDDLGRQGVRVIDVGRALGGGQALAQSETIGAFTDTTTPAEGSADTISTLARSSGHGWRLEASWPRDSRGMCSENDRSVVVKLRFGAFGLLLPGDIEAGAEHALVAGRESLAADVIKAPHHGSRTSSTPSLLAAVRPRAAIASAGRGNRYGFPHAEVEARYAEVGAPVFRTDRDGAVVVVVDRKRVRIHGSAPGRAPPIVLRERVD